MASGIGPELGVPSPASRSSDLTESLFFLSTDLEPHTQVRGQIWVLRARGTAGEGNRAMGWGAPLGALFCFSRKTTY